MLLHGRGQAFHPVGQLESEYKSALADGLRKLGSVDKPRFVDSIDLATDVQFVSYLDVFEFGRRSPPARCGGDTVLLRTLQ
jgi:hypothetical protein